MRALIVIGGLLFLFGSCKDKKKPEEENTNLKIEMLNTDRAFSAESESKGLRKAFMDYIDNDAVLLRPNHFPLAGGEAMDLIISSDDTDTRVTWAPKEAVIAQSGDLGYTYGVFSRKSADADSVFYGTYVTIWKRQVSGRWKFVLQTGNEGLK